jgi:large subunit ribosomal protein L10
MPVTREKKKKILEELKEKIEKQKIIVFVDFTGLKIRDFSELRKRIKSVGDEIKVVKKTLANLAFKEKKFNVDVKNLKGELALIFGFKDEILPAKTVFEFSNENPNLKILGGIFGEKFLEADKIIELAKLPSREELLANLTRSISAPISNLINIFRAIPQDLVFVLNQIQLKVQK